MHLCIRGRGAAGQRGFIEDAVETGRNLLQGEIVFFVAVRAATFVKMLSFFLLGRERRGFAATCERQCEKSGNDENWSNAVEGHPTSF